ncbi:hypothetical protein GCM10007898_07520 [Dyella flagellata]|uniref:Uncharacterized protein n=1 Tax=Dyella flagellata TaxID=1867833 RepID=A0ABQ5X928_9GAMM|nr:hypothetical protein GCM10007898_07520 [Dyella flagellata]
MHGNAGIIIPAYEAFSLQLGARAPGLLRLGFISRLSGAIPIRVSHMIETNPILAQIADLRARVESLRGYL